MLGVQNDDVVKTVALDYHGGTKPHLERDPSKPDVLAQILTPRTGKKANYERHKATKRIKKSPSSGLVVGSWSMIESCIHQLRLRFSMKTTAKRA